MGGMQCGSGGSPRRAVLVTSRLQSVAVSVPLLLRQAG